MSLYTEKTTFYSRIIIKEILAEVEEHGLIGGQHFYIHFDLSCMGVVVPERVRERYSSQGSILISIKRDEYENLIVNDLGMRVDLGFDGMAETVFIPFTSIMSFSDSSENFLLELKTSYHMENITLNPSQRDSKDKKKDANILTFPKH